MFRLNLEKSAEQQDVQNFHRQRKLIKKDRTALGANARLVSRCDIVIHQGISEVRCQLPLIIEDAENGLTSLSRKLFSELLDELRLLDKRLKQCEQ